ncbi:MAG: acyltransferase [Acetobacteraceae bacterium]|nr:acyltransferase [Acetobacteraceae bacterium]
MRTERQVLTSIEAARGVAASAVVLCHIGTVLGDPFGGMLRAGHAGVDFFFVLSGFTIVTVHREDVGRAPLLLDYAWKRLVRIYPIYWIATWGAVGLSSVGIMELSDTGAGRIFTSLLLVPQHAEPILGVAWTLQHEMLFYLTFGVLILNRAFGIIAFAVWACFVLAVMPWAPTDSPWTHTDLLTGFVGSSYNLEFGLGIAVAMVTKRFQVPRPSMLSALGVTGLLLAGAAENAGQISYLGHTARAMFGVSSALAIWGLAASERAGGVRAGRFLVVMGSASYATYLVHVPILNGASSFAVVKLLPAGIRVVALAAVAMASGLLFHAAVERPLLHFLRRLRPHKVTISSTPISTASIRDTICDSDTSSCGAKFHPHQPEWSRRASPLFPQTR